MIVDLNRMVEAEQWQVIEPVKHKVSYSLIFLYLSNCTKLKAFGILDSQLAVLSL